MTKTTEPNGTKNLPQQSSNSNSTHSSSCCSSSSPLSSPNIQFQQQQCQKDSYFKNLSMKSQLKRKRNPFTDCTNTSSPVLFKNLSKIDTSNPITSPSLSTPSPKKFYTPKTADLEASKNISIGYGRRYSSNKRNDKEKKLGIPTSSVPSKSKDKDAANLANSEPIKFQQQCQKDPNSFENLTMESEQTQKLTHSTTFSDCTNSSSSSVPPKSTKYKPFYSSSPVFKNLSSKSTNAVAVNLDDAANPNSSPSNFLSTPLPEKSSIPETADLEASKNISIGYGRRYSSNKRNDKEKKLGIPTSSVPSKSKDKDEANLANSEPIKFQQQCQKDPNSFENLTTESERKQKLTHTTPFADCTNTSSSVPPKSTKYKHFYSSSPVFKNLSSKSTNAVAVNLDDAANPNSSPSNFLSTPLPVKSSIPETADLEGSGNISISYGRRYSSNKRNDKEKEVGIPTSKRKGKDVGIQQQFQKDPNSFENLIVESERKQKLTRRTPFSDCPNTSTPEIVGVEASEMISGSKDKGKVTVISESSNFMDTWEEAVISESSASVKRKECDIPSSSTSISKVSNTREKSDGLQRAIPPKAKAYSVPCTKKHRAKSSNIGVLIKDYPSLQDYIKEQNAHFKEIDEFEMLVEEVEEVD